MTAQIGDVYRCDNEDYTCLRMTDQPAFDPEDYGFCPTMISTACWRGYWCDYEIMDSVLYLQKLHILDENDHYPSINGVSGTWNFSEQFYDNLRLKMDYTGKILLGAEFNYAYFSHMGLQTPMGFAKLLSLEFEHGVLKDIVDHSETARMLRELDEQHTNLKDRFFGYDEEEEAELYDLLPKELRGLVWWGNYL